MVEQASLLRVRIQLGRYDIPMEYLYVDCMNSGAIAHLASISGKSHSNWKMIEFTLFPRDAVPNMASLKHAILFPASLHLLKLALISGPHAILLGRLNNS